MKSDQIRRNMSNAEPPEDNLAEADDQASESSIASLLKLVGRIDGLGLDAVSRLAETLGNYTPLANESLCPNIRVSNRRICLASCVSLCPTQAISVDDSIRVDPTRCISCNICTTACPHGLFDPIEPPDSIHFEAILAARKKGRRIVRFSCNRCQGGYGKPHSAKSRGAETIVLPCLGSLSDTPHVVLSPFGDRPSP